MCSSEGYCIDFRVHTNIEKFMMIHEIHVFIRLRFVSLLLKCMNISISVPLLYLTGYVFGHSCNGWHVRCVLACF